MSHIKPVFQALLYGIEKSCKHSEISHFCSENSWPIWPTVILNPVTVYVSSQVQLLGHMSDCWLMVETHCNMPGMV